MKFYTIKESISSKVIRPEYPQMECIDISIKDGLDKICKLKGKRTSKVGKIFNLKLPPKSKLTDVISCSLGAGGDFIVSKRVHDIMKELNVSSVQFFPIQFEHKEELFTNFYYAHFVYELEKFIDFKKSSYDPFFVKGINSNKPKNYEDFSKLVELHKKYNHFRLAKTFLQKQFPFDEDLFVLSFANQKRYIGERCYSIIKTENITGIDIDLATDLFCS